MSDEKVNVKFNASGTGVNTDFAFRVNVEYDNVSRRRLAELETFVVGAFGEMTRVEAERVGAVQSEAVEPPGPRPEYIR